MSNYNLVLNLNSGKFIKSFDRLANETFGFTFSPWIEKGYWSEKYVPYSFADGNEIVANASANLMSFLLGDKLIKAVQIGTVMTQEKYRGQGLSRMLLEKILADYENNCDLIYLFANNSVLDFYPKFGFIKNKQYISESIYKRKASPLTHRKLNMDNSDDYSLFRHLVSTNRPIFKISMLDNFDLLMFYCDFSMRNNIFYIQKLKLAVVVTSTEHELCIHDIFCENVYCLDDVVNSLASSHSADILKITFGFSPLEQGNISSRIKDDDDNTLFVITKSDLQIGDAMFPTFSHA